MLHLGQVHHPHCTQASASSAIMPQCFHPHPTSSRLALPPPGEPAPQHYSALDQSRLAFQAYLKEQLAQELDSVRDDLGAGEASLLEKSIRQSAKAAWKDGGLLSAEDKQAYLDRFPGGWRVQGLRDEGDGCCAVWCCCGQGAAVLDRFPGAWRVQGLQGLRGGGVLRVLQRLLPASFPGGCRACVVLLRGVCALLRLGCFRALLCCPQQPVSNALMLASCC